MKTLTRVCLKCRKEFPPKHKGNYICSGCTKTNSSLYVGPTVGKMTGQRRGGVKGSD